MNKDKKTSLFTVMITDALLLLAAFTFLLPVLWMLSTAFKTPEQTVVYPPEWIPNPFTIRSFIEGFRGGDFVKYFRNSILITFFVTAGTILSCSLVAFGFAKLKARGKNIWFTLMLCTMMIPSTVTLIPMYVMYSKFGWIDTFLPLIVPSFFGASAFSIFLLRQFFAAIPNELSESALLDGCTWFGVFARMYMPNAKPSLLVVTIFSFVGAWNDYFGPMIYLTSPEKFTIPIGLRSFQSMYSGAMDFGPLMAMSLVSVTPVIILFLICQKYFIQGVVTSGLKG